MDRLAKFRQASLVMAETVDAWRLIPRVMIIAYGALVVNLYSWYKSIPTFIQQKCDAAVLKIFMDGGMVLHQAQALACTVNDVVGGPTPAQSAFVTTIIGLSTGIFGLYTATGKRWDGTEYAYHQYSKPQVDGEITNSTILTPPVITPVVSATTLS
jgi:uncharacterized membrane protein